MFLCPYCRRKSPIPDDPRQDASPLTQRQEQVIKLIAEGHSAKEIGTILEISSRTAEFHRRQIMDKLDVRSSQGLTVYALANRIITK